MAQYEVKDAVGGSPAVTIDADSYEYDATTGRHIFRQGPATDAEPDGSIVANMLNVSVRKIS